MLAISIHEVGSSDMTVESVIETVPHDVPNMKRMIPASGVWNV